MWASNKIYTSTVILMSLTPLYAANALFTFDSGGTEADGAWILGASDCPSLNTPIELNVGSSGVKQFSSINIHRNCRVTFTPRGGGADYSSNPVRLIVTGDVVIDGTLDLDGEDGLLSTATTSVQGGRGGPGGFDGGASGISSSADNSGAPGFGPGGGRGGYTSNSGCTSSGASGALRPAATDVREQLLVGGSGGGGGCKSRHSSSSYTAGSGGGGGGALLIASSGSIEVSGTVTAQGGALSNVSYDFGDGQAGSDGMIHLIANEVSGTGTINADKVIVETLENSAEFSSTDPISQIEFQRLNYTLTPTAQLQISQLDGQAITSGSPLVLDEAGEVTLDITSSGLAEGRSVTIKVTNPNTYTATTASATLDVYGNASVTLTLGSGIMSVLAYVDGLE